MKKITLIIVLLCVMALTLAACGGKPAGPAQAVTDYIHALVNKDSSKLSTLSCADWEASAMLEFDSLQAVKTRLQGLSCAVTSTDGTTSQVDCQGKIIATYNNEDQEIDLSVRTYQVVQQGSDYLVCGYQ